MVTPKLLALDLDETTLDRRGQLSPENRRALEGAIAQNIQVVVATGRAVTALPEEILRFSGIRYAITGNGAAVWDMEQKKPLRHFLLPPGAAEAILALTEGQELTYEVTVAGQPYAQRDYIQNPDRYLTDGRTSNYLQRTRRPVEDIAAFIRTHSAELDSLNLVVGSLEVKRRMMERLSRLSEVYITSSIPRLIEISNAESGKHRALAWLADHLQIAPAECAAFGNGDNDAEMLRWAGTGIAVENATEQCRFAADYVTAAHDDDGVAKAMKALWKIG